MKYTFRDMIEHIIKEERDYTIIKIDNNTVAVTRDMSFCGLSIDQYFTVIVNGKTVCTRCKRELGIRIALSVLNAQ